MNVFVYSDSGNAMRPMEQTSKRVNKQKPRGRWKHCRGQRFGGNYVGVWCSGKHQQIKITALATPSRLVLAETMKWFLPAYLHHRTIHTPNAFICRTQRPRMNASILHPTNDFKHKRYRHLRDTDKLYFYELNFKCCVRLAWAHATAHKENKITENRTCVSLTTRLMVCDARAEQRTLPMSSLVHCDLLPSSSAFVTRPNICLCITWSRSNCVCAQITYILCVGSTAAVSQCGRVVKEFGHMKNRCVNFCSNDSAHNSKQNAFSFVLPLRVDTPTTVDISRYEKIVRAHIV